MINKYFFTIVSLKNLIRLRRRLYGLESTQYRYAVESKPTKIYETLRSV